MHLIENQWYPLLESREIGRHPIGCERLGQQLVFWRTADGVPRVHYDRCPHLGASLSRGKVSEDRLVCPFHGFEFDADGQCRHIPANGCQGNIPKGMECASFHVCEAHGLVWFWLGRPRETYPPLPYFPELEGGWRYGTFTATWPVHYSRAIENQLDVAHLAFVHRTTIGAGGRSFVDGPHVEADTTGIKVWVTNSRDEGQAHSAEDALAAAASQKEPGLHFLFPGIWLLNISPRMKNFIAFVPMNERETRYYVRVYHRIKNPVLAKVYEWFVGLSNRLILDQDRRVVVTQTPLDSSQAKDDRFIGADRAIIQFRRLHAKLMEEGNGSG
jgi:phenylpropionate dioxygenase-like ring-hydroxylating dioxygenase large terminal subunit